MDSSTSSSCEIKTPAVNDARTSSTVISSNADGSYGVVGALTFDSVTPLVEAGARLLKGKTEVCLDLLQVSRTDSAGLALLIEWMREADRCGTVVNFRNIPEQLLAIATASRLAHLLPQDEG